MTFSMELSILIVLIVFGLIAVNSAFVLLLSVITNYTHLINDRFRTEKEKILYFSIWFLPIGWIIYLIAIFYEKATKQ